MDNESAEKKNKTKTPFAEIIVGGKIDKPCYSIAYFDTNDKHIHIGFSSYKLELVKQWLSEEFDVYDVPTLVEAIGIVRCKDCKHRDVTSKFECDFSSVFVFDDHFCSYGERREESND